VLEELEHRFGVVFAHVVHSAIAHDVVAAEDAPEAALKRFAMKPGRHIDEVDTPPWIALEFGESMEARNLGTLGANTVRTATWGSLGDPTAHTFQEMEMAECKSRYTLVNTKGHHIPEIHEGDLAFAARYGWCCHMMLSLVNWLAGTAVAGYILIRLYSRECFTIFSHLTMETLRNPKAQYPVGDAELRRVGAECFQELDGTGLGPGDHPCSPTFQQVLAVCKVLPKGQPRPHLFAHVLAFDDLKFHGLTCSADACELHPWLVKWDLVVLVGAAVLLLCTCICMRKCVSDAVEAKRQQLLMNSMSDDRGRFSSGRVRSSDAGTRTMMLSEKR